jgi:hypothetical protein
MTGNEFIECFFNSRYENYLTQETKDISENISLYNNWSSDDEQSDDEPNGEYSELKIFISLFIFLLFTFFHVHRYD